MRRIFVKILLKGTKNKAMQQRSSIFLFNDGVYFAYTFLKFCSAYMSDLIKYKLFIQSKNFVWTDIAALIKGSGDEICI